MNIWQACISMWRRIWDYKGSSNKGEFWPATGVNAALLVLAGVFILSGIAGERSGLVFAGTVFLILAAVSTVPWVALTVRRIRDTGRSGAWAWLLLAVGVGTMIVLFLCSASAGGFQPEGNRAVTVYGPPEWFEKEYEPDKNENVDVYGPPEWFEKNSETESDTAEFDPHANEPVCVYGPPEWFAGKGTEK